MLRVNTKPRHRNSPRIAEKSAPGFLQWLRGRECACRGRNPHCRGRIQAAHGPHKASKGTGTKSTDQCAMPLSEACHSLQHSVGWQSFAEKYLTWPPDEMCAAYWNRWPGRIAWERKLADNG